MTTTMQRTNFPQGHSYRGSTSSRKPNKTVNDSKGIWLSMLDDVSRGSSLAEKQLIILGGTPDQQREFLSTLHPSSSSSSTASSRRLKNPRTTPKSIPISNRFALGYTYHDVLDMDDEDILARLSIYMLSDPSAAFASLLKPLFTTKTVPNTLIAILLDWGDPFKWPRQLRQWIRIIRSVVESLDEDVKDVMEEVMEAWKEKRVGLKGEAVGGAARMGTEGRATILPLGPGEWEDELGVPLSVVCLNAEKQERMEKEYGWQEGDFDFALQWTRCVLLKHGASLIYTTSYDSNNVRTLIHSSLGIHSLLKRETVKYNIIDRDKIVIPPNWDSWGKIRILREDFEMESLSKAWSVEIQSPPEAEFNPSTIKPAIQTEIKIEMEGESTSTGEETSISFFISSLPDPTAGSKPYIPPTAYNDVVTVQDPQTFLAEQAQILELLKADDERVERRTRKGAPPPLGASSYSPYDSDDAVTRSRLAEQTGPYNINVGGIQVDAEEVTRRIREREAGLDRDGSSIRTPRKEGGVSGQGSGIATPDGGKTQNEALANYFAGLMKKAKGSSESPRAGSANGSATER